MARRSLADDVLSRVHPVKRHTFWYERLPSDVVAELEEVRRQYRSGTFVHTPCLVMARAIIESLQARNLPVAKETQVKRWLQEK